MKRLLLATLFGFSLSACAQPAEAPQKVSPGTEAAPLKEPSFAAGTPEARVREALTRINPKIQVESISPAPIPGFREVIATGQVVYVSDDGKYLFQGGLLDIVNRKDMGEVAMAKVRKQVLATLPQADRIVFAPTGTTKHTVVVLTDVECGYCRKFHTDIAQYNKLGIRVEYLAFPRAGQRLGLEGTPMILTDDGRLLGGYLPPDALLQRLDALDKNPDAS